MRRVTEDCAPSKENRLFLSESDLKEDISVSSAIQIKIVKWNQFFMNLSLISNLTDGRPWKTFFKNMKMWRKKMIL
ncbi:hypothetical protein TNCT_437151 [Trichonephila clavata]|uniref:Uncharacterized protein n=1 Tax=Trichonephila clavata TaxID=2740835 RepID=A0A8X6LL82_TRICU|nr:hypothetical protein TNCT_437151 [Trichonephila clavata]